MPSCMPCTKFLENLDKLEEETNAHESALAELRAHRAKDIDRVNAEPWQVENIHVLQTGLADTKEKLVSVDSSIEATKARYKKVKEADNAKLHAVQAQVEVAKETCQEAKDMAARVIEERFGEGCNAIENACSILIEN
jgi:chromosome segregation ATPase